MQNVTICDGYYDPGMMKRKTKCIYLLSPGSFVYLVIFYGVEMIGRIFCCCSSSASLLAMVLAQREVMAIGQRSFCEENEIYASLVIFLAIAF